MFLLIAKPEDFFATRLAQKLTRQAREVRMAPWQKLLLSQGFTWRGDTPGNFSHGEFSIAEGLIAFSDLEGVVCFPSGEFMLSSESDWAPADRAYITQEVSASILGILYSLSCPVLNLPLPGGRSRLFFTALSARSCLDSSSIRLPPMMVATSRQGCQEWAVGESDGVRVGSLFDPNWDRQVYFLDGCEQWDESRLPYPVFMQQVPAGQLYHLIIVGDSVIGGKVLLEHFQGTFCSHLEASDIPSSLNQSVIQCARSLGLIFSECLIVEGRDGGWYCLDWNDSPRLSHWSEPVGEAVIHLLASHLLGISGIQ